MSQKGYPAIEWLKRIKDPELRAKALQAVEDAPKEPYLVVNSIEDAIISAFWWHTSVDGGKFWSNCHYKPNVELLPFPNEAREQAKEVLEKFFEMFKCYNFVEDVEGLDCINNFLNETYPE